MQSTDALALKLADLVIAHRWWVVILALLLTVLDDGFDLPALAQDSFVRLRLAHHL